MLQARTLTEALRRRLTDDADREVCRLVHADGTSTPVTGRALSDRANAWAQRLSAVPPGIVGVCLYHGLDLHAAFIGALWAGHVPTMLAPPSPKMEPRKYAEAFTRMLGHIAPRVLVVDDETLGRAAELGVLDAPALRDIVRAHPAELLPVADFTSFELEFEPEPDAVAVLQHSSGTTGLQKGVALSHREILAHQRAYAAHLGLTRDDVVVSWLPLYHDMGFVACFLLPLAAGLRLVELSPFDWVLKPLSLLEQITRHGGTRVWLPNFAYTFLAQAVRDPAALSGLDLSGVRTWVNCSEPVTAAAHEAFLARFAPCGARADQLTASYAMAENVFAVSQSLPGALRVLTVDAVAFRDARRVLPAAEGLRFVSNGPVVAGTELRVLAAPGEQVGELALRGDYRFTGYFGRDDLTAAALTDDGWYRTGDLGFVHEGEVYVSGRLKDLIIVQGRNFAPGDIEAAVAEVPGVAPGRVVAFGLPDERLGTEQVAVLFEADAEHAGAGETRVALAIRNHVAQSLDCRPGVVRAVPARWLVKSTSGKLARGDNRAKYLAELAGR